MTGASGGRDDMVVFDKNGNVVEDRKERAKILAGEEEEDMSPFRATMEEYEKLPLEEQAKFRMVSGGFENEHVILAELIEFEAHRAVKEANYAFLKSYWSRCIFECNLQKLITLIADAYRVFILIPCGWGWWALAFHITNMTRFGRLFQYVQIVGNGTLLRLMFLLDNIPKLTPVIISGCCCVTCGLLLFALYTR